MGSHFLDSNHWLLSIITQRYFPFFSTTWQRVASQKINIPISLLKRQCLPLMLPTRKKSNSLQCEVPTGPSKWIIKEIVGFILQPHPKRKLVPGRSKHLRSLVTQLNAFSTVIRLLTRSRVFAGQEAYLSHFYHHCLNQLKKKSLCISGGVA